MEEDGSLFILGKDSHNNACLNFLEDMSYGYIQGYLRTGEILADYINEKGFEQDVLIYPLLFSYRHHIELRLKKIIKSGNLLLEDGTDYPDNHRLTKLWKDSKTIITKVCTDENLEKMVEIMGKIDPYINELDDIDQRSDAFRYWEGTKRMGRPKNVPNVYNINVRHFRQCIDFIVTFLDGIDILISLHSDFIAATDFVDDDNQI